MAIYWFEIKSPFLSLSRKEENLIYTQTQNLPQVISVTAASGGKGKKKKAAPLFEWHRTLSDHLPSEAALHSLLRAAIKRKSESKETARKTSVIDSIYDRPTFSLIVVARICISVVLTFSRFFRLKLTIRNRYEDQQNLTHQSFSALIIVKIFTCICSLNIVSLSMM